MTLLYSALSAAIEYKAPTYKEHDYSEPPKFTTTLSDRSTTIGYGAKLLASVRGCPKVGMATNCTQRWNLA